MPSAASSLPTAPRASEITFDPVTRAAVTQHHASLEAAARTVKAINAAALGTGDAPDPRALMRATNAAGSAMAATAVSLAAIDGSVVERSTRFGATAGDTPVELLSAADAPSPADGKLLALLRARTVESIPDVLALMDRMAALLGEDDGLAHFNRLYRMVTAGVGAPGNAWEHRAWIERLDVVFANLYFDGVEACLAGSGSATAAWRALMDRRKHRGIAPIQFALAGMSAHINRDLAPAVAFAWEQHGTADHGRGTPEFRDFQRVDAILDATEPQAMRTLASGLFAVMSELMGELDDWAALTVLHGARDLAWSHAQILAKLGQGSTAGAAYVMSLDRSAASWAIAALVANV